MQRKMRIILVVILVFALVMSGCTKKTEKDGTKSIQFPYTSPEHLEIESISTATIPNPDAGGDIGEDIASLEIKNTTGRYIESAKLKVILLDETEFEFFVFDLPENKMVQVFEIHNVSYDGMTECKKIEIKELQLKKDNQLSETDISYAVQETKITLTNMTQKDIEDVTVVCHCKLDDIFYGGTSYSYKIECMRAGESVQIDANDCYLGQAEVVRILTN